MEEQTEHFVVAIPTGCTQPRLTMGVVTEAALGLIGLAIVLFLAFRSVWLEVPLIPIWGFLRYQSKQEPLFLAMWAGQVTFKQYYHA